jgi:formylglycine-generating enzyme required for sulfatase activity
MTCPNCGLELKDSWKICPDCETPIQRMSRCPECGAEVQEAWRICPVCECILEVPQMTDAKKRLSPRPLRDAVLPGFAPGETIGRYKNVRELGRGAFGVVYEADSPFLAGTRIAIKVSAAEGRSREGAEREFLARERIKDEAHILKAWQPEEAESSGTGTRWLVCPMQLAEKSLRGVVGELAKKGKSEERKAEALRIFKELCHGLGACHAEGIAHLDVKPENFLLHEGKWKLGDFGSSAGVEWERRAEEGSGTAAYLSPERQWSANPGQVGARADVYSLGVILYEFLEERGLRPFEGSGKELYEKKVSLKPKRIGWIGEGLWSAIEGALSPDEEGRPEDAGKLWARVEAAQGETEPKVAPVSSKARATKKTGTKELPSDFVQVVTEGERAEFRMGGTRYDDEKPVHTVNLTQPYAMCTHTVTFEEYDRYCGATGTKRPNDEGWGRGQRPAINVSWVDAVRYCNWRSEEEGLGRGYKIHGGHEAEYEGGSEGYRLPTEAEWEYAARGGKGSRGYEYAGSDDLGEVGWYEGNSGRKTHDVEKKKENELGLYDMSGNVWEWCWDWNDSGYYSKAEAKKDPAGPGSGQFRVLRGGSWFYIVENCRVALRSFYDPAYSYENFGFRVVRRGV